MARRTKKAQSNIKNLLKAKAVQAARKLRSQNTAAQAVQSFGVPCNTQSALNSTASTVANHHHSTIDANFINSGSHKRKQIISIRNELPTSTAAASQQCSSTFFCLFCSKETTLKLNDFSNYKDVSAADFVPMFILKKMLNVPSENLVQFLSAFGHPRDWISVCSTCTPLVTEAFDVQKKICELEWKLRACQKEMKELVAKTYLENQFKDQTIDSPSTRWSGLQQSGVVTKSTRQYVASGVKVTGKPTIYLNVDITPAPATKVHHDSAQVQTPEEDTTACEPEPDNSHLDDCGGGDDDMIGEDDPQDSSLPVKSNEKIPIEPGCGTSKHMIAKKRRKFIKIGATSYSEPHYGCALCPNLKPMQLHSFVKHLVFHYDRPYKCTECSAYSSGSDIELAKQSTNFQNGNHHSCSKDTLVKLELKTEKIWDCGYCPSAFNLESQRESHERVLHYKGKSIPLPYECSRCSKKFRDYHEWLIHRTLLHKDLGKFGCFYCDKIFKLVTKEAVDVEDFCGRFRHTKKEHGVGHHCNHLLDCRICGVNFIITNDVIDHMKKEHGVIQNEIMWCPICFKALKRRRCFESHILHVHQVHNNSRQEKFMCELCPYVVKCRYALLEHKLLQHGIEPTDGRQIHSCSKDQCSFKCVTKKSMEVHMMKAHGAERKHKCSVCGKGFLNSGNLRDHQLIHQNSKVKPFQCEVCGNSFAVKNYLYIHMRLSHQNRPFASTHRKRTSKKRKPAGSEQAVENLSAAHAPTLLPSTSVTQIGMNNALSSNTS